MSHSPGQNVLFVHWHDLGRYLGVYGHAGVSSPHLDQLAAEGILFTRAHATAPLCSPSRGSLFTGRYPQSNGLVGLAHHGWEYHSGVQTLPQLLSESGWHTALFGMQHETSFPSRLGFDEYDVSNSFCEYVVEQATRWLAEPPKKPFLLTTGFFETHRPYPRERYAPAASDTVTVPDYLPDTDDVRDDLAEFYGSISVADAAVGQLLDALEAGGLDRSTWVVFLTDHGPALPRAKSTLYDAGTGIAMIVRPPRDSAIAPHVYDELFSGVDLLPTLLELLKVAIPAEVEGLSHAAALTDGADAAEVRPAVRSAVYTAKTYHDSFDPIRAVRTKDFSYIENYASRPLLDLPWDIADSPPGRALQPAIGDPRPARELYDLSADPTERHNLLLEAQPEYHAMATQLALRLNTWRQQTGDVIPSDFTGTQISDRYTGTYLSIHGRPATSRSATASDRGINPESGPGPDPQD
ncbi:sulfatase [Mycobacterium sp. CBMA293]|uniref:sulfatase family protein n=1 Tax=unclassified Mycolicibacterium TaxID=2636767 RepID=UPI0012DD6A98|nr:MULTISPECIES: sulfatase [unclassified Mycolicibacterium]MUL47926.1 sulfatase [Mycolicibacterium sp. CBMA 360]MUL59226.1 sulfatase [Mycolicibacterium sp. CBMA 335]MUL70951.1 sulfatase [Mycolicibacterium sp. CBMA 311]MUL94594.1 sulfatase [Mycolicibacterium sp. CBMA 230]MUM09228.1 sulfatase [Mycolicibacterium sp. CBMA 213]